MYADFGPRQEKLGKLTQQNEAMESKLAKLESGAQLVTVRL